MKIVFQMDLIIGVDINVDSLFCFVEEVQVWGYELFFYGFDQFVYEEGLIIVKGYWMIVWCEQGNYVDFGFLEYVDLVSFDVIWLCQDLLFDMYYIILMYLFDCLKDDVLVVNDLFWVCNYFEKLLVFDFL